MIDPIRFAPWLFAVGIAQNFLVAGVFYGWSNLSSILKSDGAFAWECGAAAASCDEQELALSNLYAIGSIPAVVLGLLVGAFVDAAGPRVSSLVGYALSATGHLLFAFSSRSFNAFMPAALVVSTSLPPLLFSSYHLASLFPGNENLAMSLLSGTFDLSSLVYRVLLAISDAGAATRPTLIVYVCAVVSPLALAALVVYPDTPFTPARIAALAGKARATETASGESAAPAAKAKPALANGDVADGASAGRQQRSDSAGARDVGDGGDGKRGEGDADDAADPPTGTGARHSAAETAGTGRRTADAAAARDGEPSAVEAPHGCWARFVAGRSPETRAFLAEAGTARAYVYYPFFAVHFLKFQLYLASVNAQLNHMGATSDVWIGWFGVLLPAGVLSVPVSGRIIDRVGLYPALVALCALSAAHSALSLVPSLPAQLLTFLVFGCFRGFLFNVNSSYLAGNFPVDRLGKHIGLVLTLAGAVASVAVSPLLSLAFGPLNGSFILINVVLLVLTLLTFAFPVAARRAGWLNTLGRRGDVAASDRSGKDDRHASAA